MLPIPRGSFYLEETILRSFFQEYVSNAFDPSTSPHSPFLISMRRHLLSPLLLSPPAALLAATPTKQSAKAEAKEPDEWKEVLVFKNGDQITGRKNFGLISGHDCSRCIKGSTGWAFAPAGCCSDHFHSSNCSMNFRRTTLE
jgi:hypothetical protein